MKKIYIAGVLALFALLSILLLNSCSKDILKRYDRRITGTWDLVDVDAKGAGGDVFRLPFREGRFVFAEDGVLQYSLPDGTAYTGRWDISRQPGPDNQDYRPLVITAVNLNTGEIRSEHFQHMQFTGTNRFKAFIYSGAHVYVFTFRR